jgi:hypothetical protein
MNWRGYERKAVVVSLKYYRGNCHERLTENTENVSKSSWCPERDSNWYLQNKSQKRYRLSQLARGNSFLFSKQ